MYTLSPVSVAPCDLSCLNCSYMVSVSLPCVFLFLPQSPLPVSEVSGSYVAIVHLFPYPNQFGLNDQVSLLMVVTWLIIFIGDVPVTHCI